MIQLAWMIGTSRIRLSLGLRLYVTPAGLGVSDSLVAPVSVLVQVNEPWHPRSTLLQLKIVNYIGFS